MYRKGNVRGAINAYKEALDLDDENDRAHAGIGEAYFDIDQNDEAIKHLRRAVALNAKNGQALVILGNVYQATGNNAKAKEAYQRYLQVAPNGKFADDIKLILNALQ